MEIKVSDPWFSFIKNKQKKIEGRLNKGKFSKFSKNDIITIKNSDESITVTAKIVKLVRYSSFEEYLTQEGLKRTLPGIKSISDGVNIYHKFYSKEQEDEFGILAIYIKIIS